MKFGSRKAGAGQATAQIDDNPDSPGRLTKNRTLSQRLTEKRTLAQPPHGKVHSATRASRKSALCSWRLTEKRILPSHLTENRSLVGPRLAECAFP